ncbi:protein of DNA polymerase subunit Cdc27 family [Pseudohyphozyma bogoriensis]|nr:protein of DNA polymerase subunit Cdc27 family [Pseudohyphozyma bogoriensis]
MADQKVAFRHITKRVALDKQTLTYRLLARELGITVAEAKSTLDAFISDPQSQAAERGIVATWALSGELKEQPGTGGGDEERDVDAPSTSAAVSRRAVLLVQASELEGKLSLFATPPSRHIYAIAPSVVPTLATLSTYSLPSIPQSEREKWKPAPSTGYGTIEHPEGERKVAGKGKGKAGGKDVVVPTKAALSAKEKAKEKEKDDKKPSTSTTTKGKEKATEKAKAAPRPMGSLGGLFAKSSVPAKRKASPPPKKSTEKKVERKPAVKKSNGIFADEELDSDEEVDDDEMQALREMEEAAVKAASAGTAKSGDKNEAKPAKSTTSAKPPPKKAEAKKPQQSSLGGFFKK